MSSTHLEYALRLGRWPAECSYYGMHPHNQVLGILNVPISKFEIFSKSMVCQKMPVQSRLCAADLNSAQCETYLPPVQARFWGKRPNRTTGYDQRDVLAIDNARVMPMGIRDAPCRATRRQWGSAYAGGESMQLRSL
jgi:hypothetical protein